MEIYLKLIMSCLLAAILSLTIKKHSPEISFLIMIVAVLGCISVSAEFASHIKGKLLESSNAIGLSLESFQPMIKCLAISFITQVSCGICKDAGYSAAATGLELTGSFVLIFCMMPLIETLFQLIGGMV